MPKKTYSGPLRVGMIGCGNISKAYFTHTPPYSEYVKIVACADLDIARAQAAAAQYGLRYGGSVKQLLDDPEIDIVLNLTIPAAHVSVNLQALKAGKHVYCEKPFSMTYKEGLKVLQEAKKRKLRLGCAPDTVLGGGIQTCLKLINDGVIGKPVAATANCLFRGHEGWHPNPDFYYQPGGGPLFDLGPYFLASLITMMGPVKSVSALATTIFKERTITSQPLAGQKIKVRTPTHICGVLDLVSGAIATVNMSFDIWASHTPGLEIYGTDGSIKCPNPGNFKGPVLLWTTATKEWAEVPLTHNAEGGRGMGLADMADAIKNRRPIRASGELGFHVAEVMESFFKSSGTGRKITIKSKCPQPKALPPGLPLGKLA